MLGKGSGEEEEGEIREVEEGDRPPETDTLNTAKTLGLLS